MACNEWNLEKRWPKAAFNTGSSGDESGAFVLELSFDFEKGVHQELLDDTLRVSFLGQRPNSADGLTTRRDSPTTEWSKRGRRMDSRPRIRSCVISRSAKCRFSPACAVRKVTAFAGIAGARTGASVRRPAPTTRCSAKTPTSPASLTSMTSNVTAASIRRFCTSTCTVPRPAHSPHRGDYKRCSGCRPSTTPRRQWTSSTKRGRRLGR